MLLSDIDILQVGPSIIDTFDPTRVQPASYDLCLAPELLLPKEHQAPIDLRFTKTVDFYTKLTMRSFFVIRSGKSVLGSTQEVITCPTDIAIRVEGKSSLARLFLLPHVAAGWIDPGFTGQITLEIVNLGPFDIILYPGMPIAQMNFTRMSTIVGTPYGSLKLGSHYQGQMGPTTSVGERNKGESK
jgi:dCTP deaminase